MLCKRRNVLLLFLGLQVCCETWSQVLPFHSYTTNDGLASQGVRALFQDSRGFIWLGTNNGLSMYDGVQFKTYSVANGLSNNWITDITESPDQPGTIWIGTIAGGVNKLSNEGVKIFRVGKDNMANNVGSIAADRFGCVWFSANKHLYKLKDDSLTVVPTPFQSKSGVGLVAGTDSLLWIVMDDSVFVHSVSAGEWRAVPIVLRRGVSISALTRHVGSGIWIALSDSSIHLVNQTGIEKSLRTRYGVPNRLFDDGKGVLWVGLTTTLLTVETSPPFAQQILPYPVDVGNSPILVDRESNLWIGSWSRGVYKLSERNLYHILFDDGSVPPLGLAASDSSGHVWVGAMKGVWEVFQVGNGRWQKHFHGFSGQSLCSVRLIDSQDRLWIADETETVWRSGKILQRKGGQSIVQPLQTLFPSGPDRKPVVAFAVDRKGRAWASIDSKGIVILQPNSGKILFTLTEQDGIPDLSARAIFEDNHGNMWIGGFYNGLSIFSADSDPPRLMRKLTTADGLPDNAIRSIHEDQDGAFWIGTRHGGLARLVDARIGVLSMKDGFLSNSVWSIVEDGLGTIWLRTDIGVEAISRTRFALLRQKNEMLGDPVSSLGVVPGRFLWFSSLSRLTVFEYPMSKPDTVQPLVHITGLIVNGEHSPALESVELPYNRNNCVIEFVGISFKDEKAIRYQYRLNGVDSTWSAPMAQRAVTYATLNPGEYKFEARAINGDGIPSAQPATLSISITPPFWRRLWFTASVTVGIAALLYSLYRYRVSRLLELERLRTRIASDLHDDVGTNLSSIMLASQIIERKSSLSQEERSQLSQLRSTAGKTQDMLKDIVWLLSPRNDSFDDFVLKLKEIAARLLSEVPFTLNVSGGEALDRLNLDVKRNIVLFFKEALNNVAKHSSATEVHIDMSIAGQVLRLSINDNGRGFDVHAPRSGNGLLNLEQRAKNLDGTMRLTSVPSRGTTVELTANITHMRSGRITSTSVS